MTLALGCIADDYTGASDLANTLTRCGLRTVQTIGVPDNALALPDVDAVVVSLKSRSIEASQAVARSREADKWLRQWDAFWSVRLDRLEALIAADKEKPA